MLNYLANYNWDNFQQFDRNHVHVAFDIAFISFIPKLIEMAGMLKDHVGINCSISGNGL